MNPSPQPRDILVVEDDEVLRSIMTRVLTDAGYVVTGARGGLDALAHLKSHAPDLMITDNRMPGMTGDALIARAHAQLPDLPILRISGADTILGPGRVVPTLHKPFTVEGLLAAVQRMLPE